ncbi:MAG: hypothetical protein AAB837_01770 [Patescibacteria group bacterium]
MNQKGFSSIVIILVAVALVAGAYIAWRQNKLPWAGNSALTTPAAGPIAVNGTITCLPKLGSGPQTMECAVGIKAESGQYYGLKNLSQFSSSNEFSETGTQVEISGVFSPKQSSGSETQAYDVAGTIDINSIQEVADAGSETVQPENPDQTGLASYPDLSITSDPVQPISVKFAVEHRSALNSKTISVRGVVVSTLLGEKACPPDRGACAQPSVFLADTADQSRNSLYDLRVIVSEEEQEKDYPVGKTVELQVSIDGNKTSIVARKN